MSLLHILVGHQKYFLEWFINRLRSKNVCISIMQVCAVRQVDTCVKVFTYTKLIITYYYFSR